MPYGGGVCRMDVECAAWWRRFSVLCGGRLCHVVVELEYAAWKWSVSRGDGGGGGVSRV